ncbi:NUDIX hydrolase [Clostridium sp. YIM B02515]|uniref:NUDIX hydrolase n=1 Tax=Clostridium rhizosphaerae TaxID=2803861 RepID=A0ABS1TBB9_9CLOT|nr:NUDIX hydrolase [Clostridium rhizosphaerae]MBL4936610.1 NUDIX hydrolase [Clostridium rhizosphaerae]
MNKLKKLTPLTETKFLSLYDAEYENRKGAEKHWIIASRKNFDTLKEQFFNKKEEKIDAVIINAIHKPTNSLVLIKQFRIPLNDYVYELPAGLLDADEGIVEAVRRELREETGLSLIEIDNAKTNPKVYISAGMTDESVAMVYCSCEGSISNSFLEDDEDIEAILVSKEIAKELLKQNIKMDIKVWLALQNFIHN